MTDDAALLAAWGAGERAAGEALVLRHYDAIVRFFRNKAGDQADDLVQRTFLVCAERATGFRGEGSVRAFLFGIARNVLFDHIRGAVRARGQEPDFHSSALVDLAPGVATLAARRADHRVLLAAMQHVPVELQVLLELYYWEDLSMDELSQILEIPAGTVKSRLHRARGLLREATAKVPALPAETESARVLLDQWAAKLGGVD
jgi:RNA polymerase sigma factor (sigma-70 family)